LLSTYTLHNYCEFIIIFINSKLLSLSETLTNTSEEQTMLPASSADNQITDRKVLFSVCFLLINALVWLFATKYMLENFLINLKAIDAEITLVWVGHYGSIIVLGFFGALISKRVNRLKFIYIWILFGVAISLLPFLISTPTISELIVLAILFGGTGSIGMSSCLAYFADSTKITNRGLFSGLTFFGINLFAGVFSFMFTIPDTFLNSLFLTAWRSLALIVFFLKLTDKTQSGKKYDNSFLSILTNKAFYLYFFAWFMFMLIDRSEAPTLRFFLDDLRYNVLAPIIGSVSALGAGILADRIGRKRVIITGFVIYGAAYALISLFYEFLIAKYIFITIESISTGILWVSFILLLWGDLSEFGSREKYYALGITPFFLTSIIQLYSGPYFETIESYNAFSLASMFLFITLLPLWLAPETLPEKKIELRRLKTFAEQAKKEREKFERKND